MQPPRPVFLFLLLAALATAGGVVAFEGGKLVRNELRTAAGGNAAKTRRLDVYPVQDEPAASAAKPLSEVMDSLDFEHDPKANWTFDIALQTRLRKGEFEALEACLDRMESSKARFAGGAWKTVRALQLLSACPGGDDRSDPEWQTHLARFQVWISKIPSSRMGPVAYAEAMSGYAWKARGNGYANTVSEEDWGQFRDRLVQSRRILDAVSEDRRGPSWYRAMQRVAMGQAWPREEYEQLFSKARSVEGDYPGFCIEKARFLMERWYGEAGEWEAFAMQVADQAGGEKGDDLYYAIVDSQVSSYKKQAFFENPRLDWPRLKRGFHAAEHLYGVDRYSRVEFCHWAGFAHDKEEAKTLLALIGTNWDTGYWHSKEDFEDYRDWVYCQGKYAPKATK